MKIARDTLVMAMDGSKMLLMRNQGDTRKPVLQTIVQEEAENPRTALQGTDRPGRSFSRASPRRSAVEETNWHEEAKKKFTRKALHALEQHHGEATRGVIVLAAPSILGDFRKLCSDQVKSSIIAEIGKDVVNHSPEDIVAIIDAAEA